MKSVVFTGGRELELMEFPDPTPGDGEVVIEMKASGMCGSDLHQYRRPKGEKQAVGGLPANPNPVIAGHEPCGIVAARGPGVREREAPIGARVMVHHYQGCTLCAHCRSGWSQLCQEQPVKVTATTQMAATPDTFVCRPIRWSRLRMTCRSRPGRRFPVARERPGVRCGG